MTLDPFEPGRSSTASGVRWAEPVEQRPLTEREIRRCASRAAEALARWLPRDVATAAANNACCVLIGEPQPLRLDLRAQLADSIQHAFGTASETLPNHRRLAAAARAAQDVRRLIAAVSSGRSELT